MNSKILPGYELYDNQSGETHGIIAFPKHVEEKYTIRRLKMNVWLDGYNWVLEQTCNSKKDMIFVNKFIKLTNRENQVIGSVRELSERTGISKSKVMDMLKKLINIGFIRKEHISIYMVNPYIYIGNKTYLTSKSNKAMIQIEWKRKYGEPPQPGSLSDAKSLVP